MSFGISPRSDFPYASQAQACDGDAGSLKERALALRMQHLCIPSLESLLRRVAYEERRFMNFGSIFKGIRQEKGLTQDQAGAMLGVSRQAVSNWENDRNLPDIEMLITMADVFNLTLDELILGGKEEMNNMTEKLINDGSEVKKTQQELIGLCIGAGLVLLGFIALLVKGQFFTYTDADGYLYENTLIMLVSLLAMFGGFLTFLVVGLRSFVKVIRHRKDGAEIGVPAIVASVGFAILAIGIVLLLLLALSSM